jgi:hypothetical protein
MDAASHGPCGIQRFHRVLVECGEEITESGASGLDNGIRQDRGQQSCVGGARSGGAIELRPLEIRFRERKQRH